MRAAMIHGGVFGSTGKIMLSIADALRRQGHTVMCCAPITSTNHQQDTNQPYFRIGSYFGRRADALLDRLFGTQGAFAWFATLRCIRELKRFSPDVIHLHTLHGSYINLRLLFDYINSYDVKIVWTLHDCWAITGHCTHFDAIGCNRWESGCFQCPLIHEYPSSYLDRSRKQYEIKKSRFTSIRGLTIVTPSHWLADIVRRSYLKEYDIRVIRNGIDLSVFKPTKTDFRKQHLISENQYMLLGVAYEWGEKKGLDVFIELSRRLDSLCYRIVLVGTNDAVDRLLPPEILSVHRTQNQCEMAAIYTAADVFINPTREETLGMVNLEALACGTPVITFRTGGSPECIDETCGLAVERNDIDALTEGICRICAEKPFTSEQCTDHAALWDQAERIDEYIHEYSCPKSIDER